LDVHALKVMQPDKLSKFYSQFLLTIDIIILYFSATIIWDDRTGFISAFGLAKWRVLATLWQRNC
jgi:hypothetical protein